MVFSSCENDGSLGPVIQDCRNGFDFTISFETICFSIVPSTIFLGLSSWRAVLICRRAVIVHARPLLLAKLASSLIYTGLQLSLLILAQLPSFNGASVFTAALALQLVTAFCAGIVSHLDHGRSPRPSLLLTGYLLLTLLFDITRSRTFWLASSSRDHELAFAAIFTASTAIKAAYLAVESVQKGKWIQWKGNDPHSPEETSGIFGLGSYGWLNSLFRQGYRKVLHVDDLFPLDHALRSQGLHERFRLDLDYGKLRCDKFGLLKVLARVLAIPLLLPVIPRLLFLGFTFCQPFFINTLLSYLSESQAEASSNHGYGLIGAAILIYSGIALSMAVYQYLRSRSLQMARGCLVAAIYTKLTEIPLAAGDESEALTLMSADLERIRFGFRPMHNLWASIIEVSLASWLLYRKLGAAFLAPVVVVICCAMATTVLVKFVGRSQKEWMGWVQKRVGLTSSVIGKMKSLRMSGLTGPVIDYIQQLRVDELAAGRRFRALIVASAAIGFMPLLLSPVFTFAVTERSLDSTKIFTSLSYLVLLANPLSSLFQDIPQFFSAVACVSRIQKFLETEPREDFRASLAPNQSEKRGFSQGVEVPPPGDLNTAAVAVKNCSFGWKAEKMALADISFNIPSGGLTIICGPTASGKSTLCRALLGEIPFYKGSITFHDKDAPVAYCDQEPFLFNGSIRDNILGYQPFNALRYASVLSATLLHVDLRSSSLPEGDHTNIGSNGIVLSGGQKQRLALARALYLESSLLILDDVFSGMDNETGQKVFEQVFGANGLLRQRRSTVVLCTHSIGHLRTAEHIVILGSEGGLSEQGGFDNLSQKPGGFVHSALANTLKRDISKPEADSARPSDAASPDSWPEKAASSSLLDDEKDLQRQKGDAGIYKHYIKSVGYTLTASILVLGAAIGFSQNFPTIWLTYWSDDLDSAQPTHSFSYYIGIYALLNVGCVICLSGLGIAVFYIAVAKAGASLHKSVLDTMSRAPLSFFTQTDQGRTVNLFSQDMNLIDTELPGALLNGVFCVFVAIGQAAVMTTASPYLAISYPFLVALLWVIQRFYLRTSRQLRLLDLETKTPLYTHFMDTSKGIVTMRASGSIARHLEEVIQLLDTSQRPAYLLLMVQSWLILVMDFVTMAIATLLTTLAVQLRTSAGFTGASLVTLMSFGDQLTQVVIFLTLLETSLGAISRIRTFNMTVEPEDQAQEDILPPLDWPRHETLELRNVSASYRSADTERQVEEKDKKPTLVLRDLNLSIPAGKKVAICGRTGSGKSTLIALLLKLLDPLPCTEGGISIGNHPLGRVDRTSLRTRLIAIPQESVFLPDGTAFRANLDPFGTAEPADCQAALESVGLWDMVQDRGGLEAAMSPDTLSVGQKQLFALSRAVVRNRIQARAAVDPLTASSTESRDGGILLLDEVSAAVDRDTERRMQDVIQQEFAHHTVLAVSHRLNMVLDYDRVVVMDQGQIVEDGNPRALSEQSGTRFRDLLMAGGS